MWKGRLIHSSPGARESLGLNSTATPLAFTQQDAGPCFKGRSASHDTVDWHVTFAPDSVHIEQIHSWHDEQGVAANASCGRPSFCSFSKSAATAADSADLAFLLSTTVGATRMLSANREYIARKVIRASRVQTTGEAIRLVNAMHN